MAKLVINYDELKKSYEYINYCISKLESAINTLDSAYIPYDFWRRQEIKKLLNQLKNDKNKLVKMKNWIINSNNAYTKILNDFSSDAKLLPNIKYGERKGL